MVLLLMLLMMIMMLITTTSVLAAVIIYVSCDDSYQTTDTSDDSQSNDEILDRLMDLKSDLTALRQSVNDRLDYIEGNLNDVITAVESQKK